MKKIYTLLCLLCSFSVYAQVATLTESFDNVTSGSATPVTGWSAVNNSNPLGTSSWFQGNINTFTGFQNGYIGANYNSTGSVGNISNWLITPVLELVNGRQIRFWTRAGGQTFPDRLEVRLSTAGSSTNVGTSDTSAGDFQTVLLSINPTLVPNVYPTAWTQYTITLSGLSGTVSGRVAFRYNVTNGGANGTNSNYIGIDEFTYNVNPATPPSCVTGITPSSGATNVNPYQNVVFRWNTTSGASAYDFYLGTTNPPTTLISTVSTDSINIINMGYNTTYYWYVVPKNTGGAATGCAANVMSFTTTTTLPTVPSNDSCGAPLPLTISTQTGTTLGATQSYFANDCGGYIGAADDDVWYQFTAISNGNVVISVQAVDSWFDPVIEANTGACGSLIPVTCGDATGAGGLEEMTINATTGTTYKIRVYSYNNGNSRKGQFTIVGTGAALPVTFVQFKGERKDNKNVLLWSTSTEQNNAGFEIERSADGKSFSGIAKVGSKAEGGNSNATLNYSFVDETAPSGNNYYRLKQVDKDGKFAYSSTVMIKGDKATKFELVSVYPNPVVRELNVKFNAASAEKVQIVITDLTGKTIRSESRQLNAGENLYNVNVATLQAGTYIIRTVTADGTTITQKFIKQ